MNQSYAKSTGTHPQPITLDCDHLLTQAGGDPQALVRLCCAFLSELPMRRQLLGEALQRSNGVERALQGLANCLGGFGSNSLSFTMELLGQAARGGHARQVRSEWKRLQRELELLIPQVQRLMLEASDPESTVQ